MGSALSYLFIRFFYRLWEFINHWYIKSGKLYFNFVINQLEELDYVFAWQITVKNFFKPLYGDYSPVGRILGFIFRSFRVLVASLIYGAIFVVAGVLYVLWLLFPIYALSRIISGV